MSYMLCPLLSYASYRKSRATFQNLVNLNLIVTIGNIRIIIFHIRRHANAQRSALSTFRIGRITVPISACFSHT